VWRILENLYRNVEKYAMPGTRVYVEVARKGNRICFVMKNISARELNIPAEELTERFIRGDASRTSEGSGLGLSIAKDLTTLMQGTFQIYLDGDLFRVTVSFPVYQ
jgi:signal transduction histidine kinase